MTVCESAHPADLRPRQHAPERVHILRHDHHGCRADGCVIWVDWTDPNRVRFIDADGRATPELDHVVPLSRGGEHAADNLVLACLSCNRSKGAKRLEGE